MTATALAAATPASRDRYLDLLRVASLAVVVLGHWIMAVIEVDARGTVTATNLLAALPALQPVTWLLQVMPVFFFVGGFGHAVALGSSRYDGYTAFVRSRATRLLRPTAAFVAVWLLAAVAIDLAGQNTGALRMAARTVAQPLWFVGVYLAVVALAPPMRLLHQRWGLWATAGLVGAAGLVDVLRLGFGLPAVGSLNLLLVWLALHQLGFAYADGTLTRGGRRAAALMAAGGLTAVLGLTVFGPYPVSMVGMPGAKVSNMSPPTVALFVHGVWLIGLVLLLRAPVKRWLDRPRVWTAVIVANGLAMTVFLWHLTALFVVAGLAIRFDLLPPVGSLTWWLSRPVWIVALLVVTALFTLLFRRFDALRAPGGGLAGQGAGVAAAIGMAFGAVGVLGLSVVGLAGPVSGHTAILLGVRITALGAVAITLSGFALLHLPRLPARQRHGARA
ncbi:acyltransferase [Pilimelia columellifera]|uniref:Acyltransferase family protein n=1 Tax=Pilimelia columellifera subsp. columellifera TaxID=706583 RepID=A0ABP6AP43_9ACTN